MLFASQTRPHGSPPLVSKEQERDGLVGLEWILEMRLFVSIIYSQAMSSIPPPPNPKIPLINLLFEKGIR